ncbi:SLC16A5 [Bugula neritina]|uniref:SLC16A5 n=1 Tax=Bugula neritina TaxID=10212 RepID=A0A7J7JTD8_BUGNE|nr:SLC16A5 [Bugula neritina]
MLPQLTMSLWNTAINSKAWKYVVLVFSLLSLSMSIGFSYGSLGPLTLVVSREFNISVTESSVAPSLNVGFYKLFTPIVAILTRFLSLRTLQWIGGGTILCGICLSSFTTNNVELILSFGLLTAVGISFTRNAALGIVREHFGNDQINFALCAMMSGLYIGLAVVPGISNYLFTHYSYQEAFVLLIPMLTIHLLSGIVFTSFSDENDGLTEIVHTKNKSVETSVKKVVGDVKVWCFALSGALKKFGMSGYFSLVPSYVIVAKGLTLENTSVGGAVFGATGIAGVLSMAAISFINFNRVLPHSILPLIGGVTVALFKVANEEVTYYLLTGILGLTNGMTIANHMTVANELGGAKNMLFVFAVEQFLQAFASVSGAPITSCIQDFLGLDVGIYITAGAIILSGVVSFLILLFQYYEKGKNEDEVKLQDELQEETNLLTLNSK